MAPEQTTPTARRPTTRRWYAAAGLLAGTLALLVITGIASDGATNGRARAVVTAGFDQIPPSEWSFGTDWLNARSKGWALANGLPEDGC